MPQNRRHLVIVAAVLCGLGWAGTVEAARAGKSKRAGHPRRRHPAATSKAQAKAAAAASAPVPATVTSRADAPTVAAPRAPASSAFGRVEFVTDKRAYLARGAADGLGAAQSLAMVRTGRVVGSCTVETLGDHQATCVGGHTRVGDTFHIGGRTRARKKSPPVPNLPAPVDEETLAARAVAVANVTVEKVDFHGRRAFRDHSVAEVSPGFVAWFTDPDPRGGTYAQERIDGVIRGVPIGSTGLRFDGAFSAVRWNTPAALERFRPGTPTQFYLWEAEASRRSIDGGTTIAVGRLWPFHTPGLTLLDGIQLGRQNETRTAEGGFYGGLIPSAISIAPSLDIQAAGLYGALTQVGERQSRMRLARQEARLGVWRGTTTGAVAEAEGLAQAWIGAVTAGGGGRLRWAPDVSQRPALERAYIDVAVRPSRETSGGLHLRYVGATLLPDAPLRGELPMTSGALHALADARWDLSSRFGLAANAGVHRDGETGRHQLHGGAETRWPRLFGETGGLWAGAEIEQGWMQGENVYAQFVGHYASHVQILARLSANGTRFETPTAVWNLHELGAYVSVDGVIASWLRVRGWSLLRAPILVQGELPVEASFGGVVGLSLVGSI